MLTTPDGRLNSYNVRGEYNNYNADIAIPKRECRKSIRALQLNVNGEMDKDINSRSVQTATRDNFQKSLVFFKLQTTVVV